MRNFLNTSALSFAAPVEAGSEKAAKIDKVVYMSADDSLKSVVVNCENAAGAILKFISSVVVHLVVRTYHHDENERRSMKITIDEVRDALKAFAEHKRGKAYQDAWAYRLIQNAVKMARSLTTDYDKKGVQDGSPLYKVLRAKTPQAGLDVVYGYIMEKTKGNHDFVALERALGSKTVTRKQPANAGKQRGSNATKASTDKPERIAKAIEGEKGHEIFNAMSGKAKAKAIKVANAVGSSNVDHLTFVMRSLSFLSTVEDLMAVAEHATTLAKDMQKAAKGKGKPEAIEPAAAAVG